MKLKVLLIALGLFISATCFAYTSPFLFEYSENHWGTMGPYINTYVVLNGDKCIERTTTDNGDPDRSGDSIVMTTKELPAERCSLYKEADEMRKAQGGACTPKSVVLKTPVKRPLDTGYVLDRQEVKLSENCVCSLKSNAHTGSSEEKEGRLYFSSDYVSQVIEEFAKRERCAAL